MPTIKGRGKIEAGAKVKVADCGQHRDGTVISLHKHGGWVVLTSDCYDTFPIEDITLVESAELETGCVVRHKSETSDTLHPPVREGMVYINGIETSVWWKDGGSTLMKYINPSDLTILDNRGK